MIELIDGGLYTTIQDYPGRLGYWDVGVPPSGPMDFLAFQIGNKLVGNKPGAAGLEITMYGPELKFHTDTRIALTGAEIDARLNGKDMPWWQGVDVKKGDVLQTEGLKGFGCRTYLSIAGGVDAPLYLGSRSTFPTGGFGGIHGGVLMAGDRLNLAGEQATASPAGALKQNEIPVYSDVWELGALIGPHGAPDYFTEDDVKLFFNTEWEVSLNSSRLGYRLEGPKVQFARTTGGEGGSHPSNLIDYSYGIGAVNFTGVTPVILTADGPSLGGFVCMATVASAEMWKIGQAKPGDKVRFVEISLDQAEELRTRQEGWIDSL